MHAIEAATVDPGSVAIHWFEQSSYALKEREGDHRDDRPVLSPPAAAREIHSCRPPVDEAEVRTDWVLLTHNHSDHTCIESLLRIRDAWPKARFAGPVESVQAMVEAGIPQERTITVRQRPAGAGRLQVAAVYAKPPEGDRNQASRLRTSPTWVT